MKIFGWKSDHPTLMSSPPHSPNPMAVRRMCPQCCETSAAFWFKDLTKLRGAEPFLLNAHCRDCQIKSHTFVCQQPHIDNQVKDEEEDDTVKKEEDEEDDHQVQKEEQPTGDTDQVNRGTKRKL